MMSDVEIIVMMTMCNLMDQFPNFTSKIRHTSFERIFLPDLLKFSILRFYNAEKHRCFFHYQLNQL